MTLSCPHYLIFINFLFLKNFLNFKVNWLGIDFLSWVKLVKKILDPASNKRLAFPYFDPNLKI